MANFKALLAIAVICLWFPLVAQAADSGCDFSRYKPLVVSHPLVDVAVKKVEPEYPATGTRVRARGAVKVKILVDRKGNVVAACAMEGHPLLLAASINAARHWKFLPNFGFAAIQRRKYIQSLLVFKFIRN
jgi:hypothetical protein